MMPPALALFGTNIKPAVDAIDYGVNATVPIVQQAVFWFYLGSSIVVILGVILLILQIRKHIRREPPISKEIDEKLKARDEVYDRRFDGLSRKVDKLGKDIKDRERSSKESRERIHDHIENLRKDMDGKFRSLGEKTANQQGTIDMMNQRQVQMDTKIDRLVEKL